MTLTEAERQKVLDALPPSARQLVPVLGLPRLIEICHRAGGRRLFIGQRLSPATAELMNSAEHRAIIGVRRVGHWDVPILSRANLTLRNSKIRAGHAAGATFNDLVAEFGLTARTVRRLCNSGRPA